MATAPSPNDLTRQQLDELDALLQRMLSVPLSPDAPMPAAPAPSAPPAPPSWRVDPPAPAPAPSPHLLLVEPPAPPPRFEAPAPAPAPMSSPLPAVASAPLPKAAPAPVAAPLPQPRPAPAPVAPVPLASAPVTPVPAAPPLPLFLLPFVALNALFNIICGLFGPPGRLLRSGFFKYLYGLAGLALLLYTAAHVAQSMGWLSLPVALPWPR